MPGFSRRFKINQGIHLEGKGRTIDIVIRDVYMIQDEKAVVFEVLGVKGLENFILTYTKADMNDIPDIKVGIAERSHKRERHGNRNNTVNLSLFVDDDYQFECRKYA